MGSYRYETHTHTADVSSCGHVKADEAVRMHKKAGYQGMVLTDHFNEDFFSRFGSVSWEEKIDAYMKGYIVALGEAEKYDMDILLGLELRFTENNNDYLVYGLDEAYLKENRDLHHSTIKDFMKSLKNRSDVLVYQAHPFRDGCRIVDPLIVHGLEIFNGNPRHDDRNELAAEVALDNQMLVISGSDFHRPGDLASGGILLDERVTNNAELIRQLKKLEYKSLVKKDVICV